MTFYRTLPFVISMILVCSACGKKPALQDSNATFDVSPISASNFQYTSVSTESKTPTQISFTAKACLKDIARVQPVLEQAFLIIGGPSNHQVVSNTDGCVFWPDTLEFNYYSQEKMVSFERSIQALGVHRGTIKVSLAVDPWKGQGAELLDLRYSDLKSLTPSGAQNSGGTSIKMININYNYTGRDFELDRLLNLKVKRHYQIRFSPVIYRNIDYAKGVSYEPLRSGRFMLRVLLMTPSKGSYEPLSFYKTPVDIIDGQVTADIILPVHFQEVPFLAYRNQLSLELSDIKESALQTAMVRIPFLALEAGSGFGANQLGTDIAANTTEIMDSSESLDSKAAKGRAGIFQGSPELSSREIFEKITHFYAPSQTDIQKLNFTGEEIQNITERQGMSQEELAHFCSIDNQLGWVKAKVCSLYPNQFISLIPVVHIESLEGEPEEEPGDTYSLSITAGFAHDLNEGDISAKMWNWTNGVRWGAGVEGGINLFGTGGQVSAGYFGARDRVTSEIHQKSDIKSQFVNFSENKYLAVERKEFRFRAKVEKCVVVSLKGGPSTGYHFCRKELETADLRESWYYMNEQATLANNALRDLANPADAGWIKVVRGPRSFARIRTILQDPNKVLVTKPDDFFFDSTGILHSVLKGMSQAVSPFSDDNIPGTIQ